jgi:hypothetical protein
VLSQAHALSQAVLTRMSGRRDSIGCLRPNLHVDRPASLQPTSAGSVRLSGWNVLQFEYSCQRSVFQRRGEISTWRPASVHGASWRTRQEAKCEGVLPVWNLLMKKPLIFIFAVAISFPILGEAGVSSTPVKTPKETVERLWKLATEGEFLTADGCSRYSGFFLHSSPCPAKKRIRVVSNHWTILSVSTSASESDVSVEFANAGVIDPELNYTPPPRTAYPKTALVTHLVLAPTRLVADS